ncbi:DNA polymerase III subunit alpha [Amphiplicatus metriothermophilus]|uniref:DNA polymerase III subunit alpha n=1 Tax=Amphiplicatus metriothermophilus TaxID=1519374 RepID=A0A239PR17_9PROT|nr:DNA polymerase III subunit alpha [Amphiplicatus metriothermophilus]MBB5518503.1 DNA polymerase-3 subunit alpha [Amphiplicatus metriothermophilus]SNT72336.1 DNA polymerase III, alpha subunit [Amphiplicatus metriothermophilus]
MTPFVHLHLHSAYSLLEGAIRLARLRDLCLAHAMPAAAVTDTNNLFGALEASETLSAAGIQPIAGLQQAFHMDALAGVEVRRARPPHLVLLAQSETGYRNLMRLTSEAFLRSAREDGPCAEFGWLDGLSEDVICLTGGYDGPVDRLLRADRLGEAKALLERLAARFPARLYVELQRHEGRDWSAVEADLVELAYALGLPLVAANEPFFPEPGDYEAHDALLCIAEAAYVHQDDRRRVTPDHYFKSGDEMAALFADLPEAVENTVEIARRCAFRPRQRGPILPRFVEGDAEEEARELERQAREGLEKRLAAGPLSASRADYDERLAKELDIINRMGFPGYFLIVSDFIKWAKAQGIPVGPGRGSGAGSLVAWALTITDLDPLRFGLLFERFLNPERVSMPDFDVDFCQDRRDEVIRYVQQKYGADRVAQIITFGKLQARAVLRDVGRVLGMPFGQVDRLCKLVPNNPANPVTLAEALASEPRLREERDRDETVAALLEKALKLEGLYRHASTHAAGVVIGDRPLVELAPLYRDPRSDMPATQFNMKWVEPAGLVKFDFLGLKTLTVIDRAVAFARRAGTRLDMKSVPLDDKATFDMLGEGATVGVFQLESAGMRATLRAMRPDSLEDIIALVSLYRPGPMENIPTYIERKQGRQDPDYLHPSLEPVLKETYGVIIYQEQVMQIAQILSGYTLGEADILRRAMGKKKKEEMDLQRKRFVEGARARGVEASKASSIFDLVQKFAGYGFNKSHAAAYAYIAYQTAYLKANHPAAFLAASMSLDRANTDKLALFLKEARETGVRVRPPHVNHSEADFFVDDDGAIVYALAAIKNVGEGAMAAISEERRRGGPFRDLHDFAERVDLKAVGKRALENLARAGALDGLGASRAGALAAVDLLIRYSAQAAEERASAQAGLFDLAAAPALARPRLPAAEEWPPLERLNEERAALGFYFSGHPLDDYARELRRLNVVTAAEARERAAESRVALNMAGVVRSVRMRRSRAGKPFAWVELSDAAGEFEITVFSEVLNAARDLFETGALLFLTVTAEDRDGEIRFTCESARRLDEAAAQAVSMLRISVTTLEAIETIGRRLAASRPASRQEAGRVVLALQLSGARPREVEIALDAPAACTPAMRGALKTVDGVAEVELV